MKTRALLLLVAMFQCSAAMAWSRPGHMLTAAIAYEELRAQDPRVLEQIIALAERHPDRGAFEVAIGGARGEERGRRIFLELARWADDTRGSIHDHPTWHYSSRPLINKASPPPSSADDVPPGSAIEAFALNFSVASDARAPQSERAVAVCWVFHLVGDMHQPLHSVSQFSKRFPTGDRGGNFQYVRDPQTNEPVTLHWFWDDAASREDAPDEVMRRAEDLMRRLPRAQFKELKPFKGAGDFTTWAEESYQLAESAAYGPELQASDTADQASKPSQRYLELSTQVAEQRLTLASYRLTDVLRRAFRQPAKQ
jgi:hypothetical protein